MLTQLQIRDFAIVEQVELELGTGFTALTGETGAGKSILVDALLLAVGGRADSGAVRHGAERAEVSAAFDLARNREATAWLDEQSIEHAGECLLRRVVTADGRSRAYVNGRPVAVQSLRELGSLLVDVHGQLEFQSLMQKARQRQLLDEFGGLQAELATVREAWRSWRSLQDERDRLEQSARDRGARLDLLQHYVGELEALAAKEGEFQSLQEERRRISALDRLVRGAAELEALLGGESGADAALSRAQALTRSLLPLDPALEPLGRVVDEAAIACREAVASLQRYASSLEADPDRQEEIESRLAALETVARKHRADPATLPDLLGTLSAELETLRNAAQSRADLDRRLQAALEQYAGAAQRLSVSRRKAAQQLDAGVSSLMQELGMKGGVFATDLQTRPASTPAENGIDDIEFLVSANPGQPPRPLARVASGGELSRISLALQVAALRAAHLPSLVFDEVDAGVGGAVAEMVGRQLRTLAEAGQVLCVTHLPQVASTADHQLRVSKSSHEGATQTRVEPLDAEARVEEIARMLGGSVITEKTREHAREMLQSSTSGAAARPPKRATSARGSGSSRASSGRAGSASGRRA